MVATEVVKKAADRYNEVLVDLRLIEGGGFKVPSQHRRALWAALDAVEGEMRAQALERAADLVHDKAKGLDTTELGEERGYMQRHNRQAVAKWLREMAEEERG